MGLTMIRQHENRSVSDQIYETLRKNILDGSLKPGDYLVEAKVAKELNVSITPVRRAFMELHGKGLLEVFPYRGSFVKIFTYEDAEELIEARKMFEPAAYRLGMNSFTEEDIVQLEEYCRSADAYAEQGDILTSVEQDIAFHEYIVMKGGNRIFSEIWNILKERITFFQVMTKQETQKLIPLTMERHQKIMDAIRNKDYTGFVNSLSEHLTFAVKAAALPRAETINYR